VAGECFAEGAEHTLTTILHEAAHALAHVRGVKDTSRQGKYHNRRYLELAAELGLHWPVDAKAHPVNGFSEVQLSPRTREGYAETIGELDEAIMLHLDTFRRLGLAGGQPEPGAGGQDQDDDQTEGEGSKTFQPLQAGLRLLPRALHPRLAKAGRAWADPVRDLRRRVLPRGQRPELASGAPAGRPGGEVPGRRVVPEERPRKGCSAQVAGSSWWRACSATCMTPT
jgi:hypothetical protein